MPNVIFHFLDPEDDTHSRASWKFETKKCSGLPSHTDVQENNYITQPTKDDKNTEKKVTKKIFSQKVLCFTKIMQVDVFGML